MLFITFPRNMYVSRVLGLEPAAIEAEVLRKVHEEALLIEDLLVVSCIEELPLVFILLVLERQVQPREIFSAIVKLLFDYLLLLLGYMPSLSSRFLASASLRRIRFGLLHGLLEH